MTTQDLIDDPLVDRATRLFDFLTKVQQLKNRPIRHIDSYGREEGTVVWFHELPNHEAVQSAAWGGDPEPDDPVLTLDRIPRLDPPEPDEELAPWIAGRIDRPDMEPELKDQAVLPPEPDEDGEVDSDHPARVLQLEDHREVEDAFLTWFEQWEAWASRERTARPARELYNQVFRAQLTYENAPEDWEVVVGVGALAWHPDEHDPVLRHCLTRAVTFDFDDDTGRLAIRHAEDGQLTVELDMLDLGLWPDQPRLQQLKDDAADYSDHVLHRDRVGDIARRLTHNLSPEGTYVDEDVAADPHESLRCAYAPALILRKRTQQGLVDVFQTIKQQIEDRNTVPAGLRILLDPAQAPDVTEVTDPATGAWVTDGDDTYLPLAVNDRQRDVIERVDRRAMTLVQGPPGTGKTHTAAALISHLLAQGKRVLVTAQTDQALKEVRSKVPEAIQDLSVSIVGAGREELADLRVAVKTLSQAATEYTPEESDDRSRRAQERIEGLKATKSRIARELLEVREAETLPVSHAGYEGTLAQIAAQHAEQADQWGWLASIATIDADTAAPLSDETATELLRLLRDRDMAADEPESAQDLPDLGQLPDPDEYALLLDTEGDAADRTAGQSDLRDHAAYEAIAGLDVETRGQLRQRIDQLAVRANDLARRHEQWLSDALGDVRSGKLQTWQSRHDQIAHLTGQARPLVEELGPVVDVKVATSDPKSLLPHAKAVRHHLTAGKTIRLDSTTHKPKQGLLTAKAIKDAEPLFDKVLVDGLPPTSSDTLDTFTTWVDATSLIDALDQAWPRSLDIPREDSLPERLAWHEAELLILADVMALGGDLVEEERRLEELGVPKPDWTDLDGVRDFARLVDAADTQEAHETAAGPLAEVQALLADAARWPDAAPVVHQLHAAAQRRDPHLYRDGYQRLVRLLDVREQAQRRDELASTLAQACPTLMRQLADDPDAEQWDQRLRELDAAWRWAAAATWIQQRNTTDVNALQDSYNTVEDDIREQVAELAANRAWSKAVHRLDQQSRSDLEQYAQLVKQFGKGTGKYAPAIARDMREAMQRCRPSVPVWIMPLYRIAQSLQVDADLFDVIIVDEASQAGLEATFLQYLAPKIVVIGDDKQNSPRAVGVDQQHIRDLARQYLHDDRYRASWQNPKRSLFDEARMRFGDLITLTEHRRCVPDIIGFSNRIAYEPDGIRLTPVRQTGSNAPTPIKPVFIDNGYLRGERNRTNPAEVDAIVEQVEKCIADDRYTNKTFGIISLTGAHQAKAIETALMRRLDPREWQAHDLRCGTAPDFQGSERHIMFLSMVTVLDDERRYSPLTSDTYIQQFNVAVSRAQDQVWVFHSVRPDELTNHDDMRYQLLDYCYGVTRRREEHGEGQTASPVPEDRPVSPFESLFEQRVHNRIFDRGHVVIPQYPVGPYRIDLVVVGAKGKLAVECDGDRWHGPDRYEKDMARQRELQRSGWEFFRVRESEFNIDPHTALEPLWELLDELETAPPDPMPPPATSTPAGEEPDVTIGLGDDMPAGSEAGEKAPTRNVDTQASPAATASAAPAGTSAAEPATTGEPAGPSRPRHTDPASPSTEGETTTPPAPMNEPDTPLADLAAVYATPAQYKPWDTSIELVEPNAASPSQLRDGMLRIVATEGPIVGQRLYQLYVKSAGGSKVGSAIRRTLNRAIRRLVDNGELIADDPLTEVQQSRKTYRLPDQPPFVLRQLGDRTIHEIPPIELAARLRALSQPGESTEATFRRVLDSYGLRRLSSATRETLEKAATLISEDI